MNDWDLYDKKIGVAALMAKTITEITGLEKGSERVTFTCSDGSEFVMYHLQDCCENVSVEDITGNVADLIGSPVTMADESTSKENPEGYVPEYQDSFTWSFYKFATVKGYVDIAGSANQTDTTAKELISHNRRRPPHDHPARLYRVAVDGWTCIAHRIW